MIKHLFSLTKYNGYISIASLPISFNFNRHLKNLQSSKEGAYEGEIDPYFAMAIGES